MDKIKKISTKYGDFFVMNNDFIGRKMLSGEYFEGEIIERLIKYIKPNSNVIDIGANIGVHSIAYANEMKNCTIHSFEPQKFICDNLLRKTISLNNITNIIVYNEALGHKNTKTTMNKYCDKGRILDYNITQETNFGGQSLGEDGESVDMRYLDYYNFENVSLIKIDVEGAEKIVISGAIETIKKNRPVVFYEDFAPKRLTKEMISMFNLPSDIINFDIEKFFLTELKYSSLVRVGDNYLCLP
jgi:FkbM family methyltransferase